MLAGAETAVFIAVTEWRRRDLRLTDAVMDEAQHSPMCGCLMGRHATSPRLETGTEREAKNKAEEASAGFGAESTRYILWMVNLLSMAK